MMVMPYDRRLNWHEKQLVSLRVRYLGGHSHMFRDGVHRLLKLGFTPDEMKAADVDDTMRKWIDDAGEQAPRGSDLD